MPHILKEPTSFTPALTRKTCTQKLLTNQTFTNSKAQEVEHLPRVTAEFYERGFVRFLLDGPGTGRGGANVGDFINTINTDCRKKRAYDQAQRSRVSFIEECLCYVRQTGRSLVGLC